MWSAASGAVGEVGRAALPGKGREGTGIQGCIPRSVSGIEVTAWGRVDQSSRGTKFRSDDWGLRKGGRPENYYSSMPMGELLRSQAAPHCVAF